MNRMEDEARTGMPDAIHACLGEISKPTYSQSAWQPLLLLHGGHR